MSAITKKVNNQLSDGKPMRRMEDLVRQRQMFNLGKFNPEVEDVAKVKDVDDAMNISRIYTAVMGNQFWVRANEYGFYHRNLDAPLGKELLWIEDGVRYRKLIPDVPVQFDGKEVSLQKVVGGMGICPSISLLRINQTDDKEFTVSPIDLTALVGKIRAINFMRNGWAEPDAYGFPDGNKPSTSDDPSARYGDVKTDFENAATGWHGSIARCIYNGLVVDKLGIYANSRWAYISGVAFVGHDASIAKGDISAML